MNYLNLVVREPIFFQRRHSGEIWEEKKRLNNFPSVFTWQTKTKIFRISIFGFILRHHLEQEVYFSSEFASLSGKRYESEWLLNH